MYEGTSKLRYLQELERYAVSLPETTKSLKKATKSISFLGIKDTASFFKAGILVVNNAAGLMLLFSCVVAVLNSALYALNELLGTKFEGFFKPTGSQGPIKIASIRYSLCTFILVALNFLVASDVIDTLIKPVSSYKMQDLYKLAMIAGVRTLLAYFLGKEVDELMHEIFPHGQTTER